jgi:hypothetical protein
LGIDALEKTTARLFYGAWLVLINESDRPFVTSDNPAVAYYASNEHSRASIYVPIAPDIAILIDANFNGKPVVFPLKRESSSPLDRFAVLKTKYIEIFNDLIIKAAEQMVFSGNEEACLECKVKKFKDWRMETVVDNLAEEKGTTIVTRQLVRKVRKM